MRKNINIPTGMRVSLKCGGRIKSLLNMPLPIFPLQKDVFGGGNL